MDSKKMSFANTFALKEELGKGAYSTVYRCVELATKKDFAAKVVKTNNMKMRDLMKLESEARICRKLNHPNIVRLHRDFNEPPKYYLVFDLVTGGELFDDLVSREDNYSEHLAAKCCQQLLVTLDYCHEQGIVHRDIKPENILLVDKDSKIIKVADFGLAVQVRGDELQWFGLAGTPCYIAPEVLLMRPYGKPVDLWAIGVVLYIMLVGYQPFYHEDSRRLNMLIKTGDYEMTSEPWATVSEEAKDLVSGLLCVVPHRRLTAARGLAHAWFKAPPIDHLQETAERLKSFNARRKMKAAAHATMLINKFLTLKAKNSPDAQTPKTSSSSSTHSARSHPGRKPR